MAEMGLLTSARSHNGPQLHVREHHYGIYDGETQSILPHQFWPNQLGQQHQRRKLAGRINGIPHERPAEIRAQGTTFALLHGEYTWGFSAHGQQSAQWRLEARVLIERRGRLVCRESRPSREDPLLALM